MESDHRELLLATRNLIVRTRGEISQLQKEIEAARETIEHSLNLLLRSHRPEASPQYPAKPL